MESVGTVQTENQTTTGGQTKSGRKEETPAQGKSKQTSGNQKN